ncbi:hypothetical protein HELRODRAFT_75680 [Helobdella robusta]|uniref:GOLD domain-containing protein n=1 Tax=Helobdella robusta TaxID=6412 RepID=T1G287_HELRO|nr:hypothetical protein HELRODRAFT_75680 [Helobdella robusta]ESO08181.1 hypothetical protein HELRODRAFT_75680 [Helobdella robusta]
MAGIVVLDSIQLLVAISIFSLTDGLYFHLSETSKKCFIEEVPENTLVTGIYRLLVYDENSKIFLPANRFGVHIDVTGPDGSVTLSRIYAADGRLTFTSAMPGEHVICINSNSSAWYGGSQMEVHLEIRSGQHDYLSIQSKKQLPELQLRVKQLLTHVQTIIKEQQYQKYRERQFRTTSESTYKRVWLWALIQSTIAIFITMYQLLSLRKLFFKKKLI